jgi:hypothetical protein
MTAYEKCLGVTSTLDHECEMSGRMMVAWDGKRSKASLDVVDHVSIAFDNSSAPGTK